MQYEIGHDIELLGQSQALVLGFFEDSKHNILSKLLAEQMDQLKQRIPKKDQIMTHLGKNNQYFLLINQGKSSEFQHRQLVKRIQKICDQLNQNNISEVSVLLEFPDTISIDDQIRYTLSVFDHTLYQFNHFKSEARDNPLKRLTVYSPSENKNLLTEIEALNKGVRMARDLGNTPANICTPSYLAATAQELSQHSTSLSCKIIGPEEMEAMGMGALLAVSAGSEQEPRLIELQYRHGGDKKPVVLVGKGITFDSGGLTIKPGAGMQEMKYDMCGAASVLGVLKTCAEMKLKINVIGLIASAENMISGKATKPGDVVTTMSGQSVEIINTDAEGRLVLADALTYAEQFDPEYVIDIATLTGAMVVALGDVNTGFMTRDEELAASILTAAKQAKDACWRMPISEEYESALDSNIADMLNATFDRNAGAITAACFLSRFTKAYRWAHMDIAGTAWKAGKNCNASGRPVPVLVELLKQHAHHHAR